LKTFKDPYENELVKRIAPLGGSEKVLNNKEIMKKLLDEEAEFASVDPVDTTITTSKQAGQQVKDDSEARYQAFQRDYRQGIDHIIEQNLERFSKTFTLELGQFGKNLEREMRFNAEWVVKRLQGPWERINDSVTILSVFDATHANIVIDDKSNLERPRLEGIRENETFGTCSARLFCGKSRILQALRTL
jgi:hypothetical protein